MNRRWFLKLLVSAPLVPLGVRYAAALDLSRLPESGCTFPPTCTAPLQACGFPSCSDIIATVIEDRRRFIVDNFSKNNALLATLRKHDERMRTDPEYRSARWREQWRGAARYAWYRGETVRIDPRCPSGYAKWRDACGS